MYPYLPKNRKILYVKPENKFMREATKLLITSGCVKPVAAVIVKNKKIIGRGTNAIKNKRPNVCPLKEHGRGTAWNLCKEICGQEGHAEIMVIRDALKRIDNLKGASVYLVGHWWVCKPCWDEIIRVGISRVYLHKDSIKLYRTNHVLKRRTEMPKLSKNLKEARERLKRALKNKDYKEIAIASLKIAILDPKHSETLVQIFMLAGAVNKELSFFEMSKLTHKELKDFVQKKRIETRERELPKEQEEQIVKLLTGALNRTLKRRHNKKTKRAE